MIKRKSIHAEITPIKPFDEKEMKTQRQLLEWIESDAEIFRLSKPATHQTSCHLDPAVKPQDNEILSENL